MRVHLMAGKKWQYASTLASEEGDVSQGYLFACVKVVPTKVLIWTPEQRKFRKLVEQGIIKGKVTNDDIILDQVTPELIELIESERYGLLFDWQDPRVLKKEKISSK